MNKKLIWIFALMLLALPIANAVPVTYLTPSYAWIASVNNTGTSIKDVISNLNMTKTAVRCGVTGRNVGQSVGQIACYFDGGGTNNIVRNSFAKASLGSFSISLHAKADTTGVNNIDLVSWNSGGTDNMRGVFNYAGISYPKMWTDSDAGGVPNTNDVTTAKDTAWHSYIFVCNSTKNIATYVDGKRASAGTMSNPCANQGSIPLHIGGSGSGAEDAFQGYIQDVYFYNGTLKGSDALSLNFSNGDNSFYPFTPQAPVISAITNRTTFTTAVINWTTDLASNTSVNYGLTKSLGTWSRTNDAVTAHSKTISGLSPLTKYYFNVTSCASGVCGEGGYNVLITKQLIINLSIASASPPTNRQYKTNPINFQANLTSNLSAINCSLTLGGSVVKTKILTTQRKANFTRNISSSGNYTWSIACTNTISYQANMTANRYFYFDAVRPNITTTFVNNSAYYRQNLTGTFTFTDDFMLYSYNMSIDGRQVQRKTNLNGTTYQLNFSQNITYLGAGVHRLTSIMADGHTSAFIGQMDTSTGLFGDKLTYTDKGKDISIRNKDNSIFDEFTTTKLLDRYTWTFVPSKETSEYTFTIEADNKITIKDAPNTYLKKWLIIDNKWMDFDIKDEDETISILRLTPTKVEVTLGNIKNPSSMTFNSIGELNYYSKNYTFFTVNATLTYQTIAIETQTITTNLTVNRNSTITTSATFRYNRTSITPTKTSTATQDIYRISYITPLISAKSINIPLNWNLTVGSATNKTIVYQKTYQMFIDNCTYPGSSNRKAIQFNTTIEGTNTLLNSNASGQFKVWMSDHTIYRQFNIQWQEKNSSYICILPNATFNLDYNIEYKKGGYFTRHRADFGTYINRTTQEIRLLLLSTTGGATVTIALVNQLNQAMVNYLIKLNRFDSGTGNYTEVQSEITDVLGYSSFFNFASSTKYRFIVKNSTGQQVYDTGINGMYIVNNPTTLTIFQNQGQTGLSEYYGAWQIRTTLYNRSTKIILQWATLAGTSGTICMNITRSYNTSLDYLSGACSTSPSGNMTYNFSAYHSGKINAVAYIKGTSIVTNVIQILLTVTQRLFQYIGVDGLIIYMLLVVIAAAIAITNIKTIPFSLMLAHIISWYLGVIPGSLVIVVGVVAALMVIMWRIED